MDPVVWHSGRSDLKHLYFMFVCLSPIGTGRGKKVITLCIGIDGKNYPLVIEEIGKAYVAYYSVNNRPPIPLLSDDKITKIRDYLGESNRLPKPRKWHYIKATNNIELKEKLEKIIEILQQK
jgi:hypothetical protein